MKNKELLINQIPQIEVDGSTNIPTALYYDSKDSYLIGSAAFASAPRPQDVNCDFKLDLGNHDPTGKPKQTFRTACGERKSAQLLTDDFLTKVLRHTSEWLARHGVERGTRMLLAEPLAMQDQPEWLANYRKCLKQLLEKRQFAGIHNIEFADLDFLPEPFAVFQYYRYGYRHPLLLERKKNQALVVDFGGGTFDICIIETKKEGDIKQGGPNSKPIAAQSEPVGGFFVNRVIAEHLFRKHVIQKSASPQYGGMFAKGLRIFSDWRANQVDLNTCKEEYRHFVQHFHEAIFAVENMKLSLCKSVGDWHLAAPLSTKASAQLPQNPFAEKCESFSATFTAPELRDLFRHEVWDKRLKGVVERTLERGLAELNGAPITVVLLSGGSANIGWLRELLQRDFASELSNAEILQLPDFQEVVAKGLAVECARRFYSEDGDFASVTYNRLCLVLDPNGKGPQLCLFGPVGTEIPRCDMKGVLLPSASLLKGMIEKPMRWKVHHLGAQPKRLDYYFLRSSFDHQDTENRQNVEERTVFAPADCIHDAEMKLELLVSEDGTARPKFIFKTGQTERETLATDGKPFYLDMTYGQTAAVSGAYIGLDFGTSNISVSFVSRETIGIQERRASEKSWNELSDLAQMLPYPLAAPLASFLSQADANRLQKAGREFIEAALALAAYVAYLESCVHKGRGETYVFKGFTQRSAGPLWRFLQDALAKLPHDAEISGGFRELLRPEFHRLVDEAVNFVAAEKHDKASASEFELLRPVQVLANVCQRVFEANVLGSFEQIKKVPFSGSYRGLLRQVHGSPPFLRTLRYKGEESFSEQELFLVSVGKRVAMRLAPLLFWKSCSQHPEDELGHCYIYDIPLKKEGSFSFKAVGFPCPCEIELDTQGAHRAVAELLQAMRQRDQSGSFIQLEELAEA
ncbi:MAG: hypothetical protein HY735_16105 [Verrucomicrobia bacterium]|nr:hypothetical protein [Verrucomicrobiota bacterium]